MSAASMLGRVAKMEGGRRGVVVVWKHSDETEDSAIARWMAEHPDRPDPHGAALTVYLISWQREWAAEGAVA